MVKYRIRPAKPSEAQQLTELAYRAKAHWGYPEKWLSAWQHELTVTPEFIENSVAYVAEFNNKIKGFWAREITQQESPSRGMLFVDPGCIGTGCGRQLWEVIKLELIANGVKSFVIEADPNAVPFYLKLGAEKIGEIESQTISGRKIPLLKLRLI